MREALRDFTDLGEPIFGGWYRSRHYDMVFGVFLIDDYDHTSDVMNFKAPLIVEPGDIVTAWYGRHPPFVWRQPDVLDGEPESPDLGSRHSHYLHDRHRLLVGLPSRTLSKKVLLDFLDDAIRTE